MYIYLLINEGVPWSAVGGATEVGTWRSCGVGMWWGYMGGEMAWVKGGEGVGGRFGCEMGGRGRKVGCHKKVKGWDGRWVCSVNWVSYYL